LLVLFTGKECGPISSDKGCEMLKSRSDRWILERPKKKRSEFTGKQKKALFPIQQQPNSMEPVFYLNN